MYDDDYDGYGIFDQSSEQWIKMHSDYYQSENKRMWKFGSGLYLGKHSNDSLEKYLQALPAEKLKELVLSYSESKFASALEFFEFTMRWFCIIEP